jgi:hypothetical protein
MHQRHKRTSITEALETYHYPEDENGNPIPTPSLRSHPQSSDAHPEIRVRVRAMPMPTFVLHFGRRTRS